MKTQPAPQRKATAADSSAPAADRPTTATNAATPQPASDREDLETDALMTEDPLGNLPMPPEILVPRLAQLETWDEAAMDSGFRVTPQAAEDEAEYPEILVEEGADEAEEELRAAEEELEQRIEHEAEAEEGESESDA